MELIYHGIGHYHPKTMKIDAIWPHHDIIIVLKGEVALKIAETPCFLCEGDAVVIPPRHPFTGEATTNEAIIWVLHFRKFTTNTAGSPFEADAPEGAKVITNALGRLIDRLLVEEFTREWTAKIAAQRPSRENPIQRDLLLMAELILRRIEEAYLRSRREVPPRLRTVVEATLREHLDYDVAKMAQLAGVCPSRFRQLFVQYYGISPLRFLIRARMEKARQLMCETNCPIKEISRIVGYSELAAFHHAFTREVGMSPGAYRKRQKEIA